jgi:hypothetical protein
MTQTAFTVIVLAAAAAFGMVLPSPIMEFNREVIQQLQAEIRMTLKEDVLAKGAMQTLKEKR